MIRLALDTGATTTMIPQRAALAIGVNPARATNFRETLTASGKEMIPFLTVPHLRIFDRVLHRVRVACHDLPAESPIDGLLGLDILIPFRAVIDPGKRTLGIPIGS